MKISKKTLEVLKNFASINPNLLIRPGNVLNTIPADVGIFAPAEVSETFDREIGIYDLNTLLALLSMMDDTDVEFGDDSLSIKKDLAEFKYYYADKNILVAAPDKIIEVDSEFAFKLSTKMIDTIKQAASIVSASMLSVIAKNGKVVLSVGDPGSPRSNTYTMEIGEYQGEFDCRIPMENFKVISTDYDVVLSKKKFMHLHGGSMQYWIALDQSSKI